MAARVAMQRGGKARLCGFSLIEVLLTLSALLIGIAALSAALPLVMATLGHEREIAAADRVARTVIEDCLDAHARGALPTGASDVLYFDSNATEATAGRYIAQYTVTENAVVGGGRQIDVNVSWTEATVPRSWALVTYAYND